MKLAFQLMLLILPSFCFGQQTVCVYNDYKVIGNDTINRILNNTKEGLWIDYDIAYNAVECFTSKSCHHQEAIRFIKSKGAFLNGHKVGEWNDFYATGELRRKYYFTKTGKNNQTSIEYFKDGKLKSEHKWKNNMLDSQVVYFENGKIKYEAKFETNTIESFKIYFNSGQLKFHGVNVIDWKIEQLNCFDKNGVEKKTRRIGLGELLSSENLIDYL